jgi:hypothetical protein
VKQLFEIETDNVRLSWHAPSGDARKLFAGLPDADGYLKVTALKNASGIKVHRAGVPALVADDSELIVGPQLHEQTDYEVFVQSKLGKKIGLVHSDPNMQKVLVTKDGGRIVFGSVNFGSEVGYTTFSVTVNDQPEFEFVTEVYPTKLDYKSDYEQLVAEVQEYIAGLVLEFIRSTFKLSLPTLRHQSSTVEWLLLLQMVVKDLEQATLFISRNPIRGLVTEFQSARAERIKRLDSYVRKSVHQGAGSGEFGMISDVPIRMRIPSRQTAFTLNTPEHRWIATQLRRTREKLISIRLKEIEKNHKGRSGKNGERHQKLIASLMDLEERILRMQQYEPFKAVAEPPPPGFASLQLISAPGYRECYKACNIMTLGLQLEGGPVNLSLKEISTLYEYWCFLTLVHMVSDKVNKPVIAKQLVRTNASGLEITLKAGRESKVTFEQDNGRKIDIFYNREIQDEATSLAQRPDMMITLDEPNWPTLNLLLDAKYRVRFDDEYVKRYGAPGPDIDAVNALHRYRDAILESGVSTDSMPKRTIIQAAAVFPFRDSGESTFKNSKLWHSIEKLGIGAIPFLPGDKSYMQMWLDSVLDRSSWSIADRAISHVAISKAQDWREAASEAVLVGVLRFQNASEHFDWIQNECQYYIPLRKNHSRQLATKWVAIYTPASILKVGAVTHWAKVKDIEVVTRSDITTPWATGRGSEELCVLYKLEPMSHLSRQVQNMDENNNAQRFSNPRWSSRLAIERAVGVLELLLETEPEWRLYEELKAANIRFKLKAGKINPLEQTPWQWRAWFLLQNEIRLRYAGLQGYLLKETSGNETFHAKLTDLVEMLHAEL